MRWCDGCGTALEADGRGTLCRKCRENRVEAREAEKRAQTMTAVATEFSERYARLKEEWVGWDLVEAIEWRNAGFTREEAEEFRESDFELGEAYEWFDYDFSGSQAKQWSAIGVDSETAKHWRDEWAASPSCVAAHCPPEHRANPHRLLHTCPFASELDFATKMAWTDAWIATDLYDEHDDGDEARNRGASRLYRSGITDISTAVAIARMERHLHGSEWGYDHDYDYDYEEYGEDDVETVASKVLRRLRLVALQLLHRHGLSPDDVIALIDRLNVDESELAEGWPEGLHPRFVLELFRFLSSEEQREFVSEFASNLQRLNGWQDTGLAAADVFRLGWNSEDPSKMMDLLAAGVPQDPQHLKRWSGLTGAEVLDAVERGFDAGEAMEWIRYGIALEDATEWSNAGFSPKDAAAWVKAGVRPAAAQKRNAAGLLPPRSQ